MSVENKEDYLRLLGMAFRDLHTCEARHKGTMPIVESINGQVLWDGQVEIFELTGHPLAKVGYAWCHRVGDENHVTAILQIPPVDSPRAAVQAAIAAFMRNRP